MKKGTKTKVSKILNFYGIRIDNESKQNKYLKAIKRRFNFNGKPKDVFEQLCLQYEIDKKKKDTSKKIDTRVIHVINPEVKSTKIIIKPVPKVKYENIIREKRLKYKTREQKQDFYRSAAWRSLRYDILKEQGAKCQLCGRGRKHGTILHCDHIIPLSKDWSKRLDKNNIQVLCEDCNIGKSNKDSIDWR